MAHGLFDLPFRLAKIDPNGDPLVKINQVVNWELFRPDLAAAYAAHRTAVRGHERTSEAGRPGADIIVVFKMSVIQSLYNLSDQATEPPWTGCRFSGSSGWGWAIRFPTPTPCGI